LEIEEAFKFIDSSGDGYFSASEIKFALDLLGENVTDEEVDEMIKMIDFDGDGQVNLKEFKRMASG
jgi:Ca2+-binding EF-hand superfamily protein